MCLIDPDKHDDNRLIFDSNNHLLDTLSVFLCI